MTAGRAGQLRATEVAQLRQAICKAEAAVLSAAPLADPRAEAARQRALEAAAECLTGLAAVARHLGDGELGDRQRAA